LGPKVSALLADTAKRVEPAERRRGRMRRVMFTGLAVAGLVAAAGAVMTRRSNVASFDDSMAEPEPVAEPETSKDDAKSS
jgi:hypothetical protein